MTFATLGPPSYRPHSHLGQDGEHALAFILIGLAFGLAYTRHRLLTSAVAVVMIGLLEILQLWAPGRHARFEDFAVDALTAGAGLAFAAGLDWAVLSEHGHSENIERAEAANAEAAPLTVPGRFVVLPGMEYTGPVFHANVLGGVVHVPSGGSVQNIVDAARRADSDAAPVTAVLNHPSQGKTAADAGRAVADRCLAEAGQSVFNPSYSRHSWDSQTGMVQTSGTA